MKRRYDVYGIGNALVDVQYRVSPAFLEQLRIVKGGMTLIDVARRDALMAALGDVTPERASGGSAANTMIGLANLGGRTCYACLVGHDPDGEFYLADLAAAGVDAGPSNQGDGPTGTCLVLITPDADRTLNTFLGISAAIGPPQVDAQTIRQSEYFYIEGYLLSLDSGVEALRAAQRHARDAGTRVALTLSDSFIVHTFRERVQRILRDGVDLLFCNADEARAYTGLDGLDDACAALAREAGCVAVTCGADGALIRQDGITVRIPGRKVDAVDTNGAGDMFAGAYLYGITHGYNVTQSAKLAVYASSRVVTQFGPRLTESLQPNLPRILSA